MQKTLLSVVGPTAIGKTKLAIALAQYYDTEIISADSRQFYKEMEIGTAVPDADELSLVKHHFIQHKSVLDTYSVGDFERDALQLLDNLFKKKEIVILVGGSGLYIDAVTRGLDEFPEIDSDIRKNLNERLHTEGIAKLQKDLKLRDISYYHKVDLDNPHRIVRALEVCIGTGKPYSSFLSNEKKKRPFNTIAIGLVAERALVYERINTRVDKMIAQGLVDEARKLIAYNSLNALQTVGYKELFKYLDGDWSLEFAISEIKKNTRRFAKRQMTWFKRNSEVLWLSYDIKFEELISEVNNLGAFDRKMP